MQQLQKIGAHSLILGTRNQYNQEEISNQDAALPENNNLGPNSMFAILVPYTPFFFPVEDVSAVDLLALGLKVPQVNLEVVAPGGHQDQVRMRVHERGAGITEACGTGACAAAYAAARWGLATPRDGKLVVEMDGGSATVTLDSPIPGRVTLTGPATYIGTVEINVDDMV